MYPFSCVLWAIFRQIARYLPHHRSENASKTHPKSSHDKFKTASYYLKIQKNRLLLYLLMLGFFYNYFLEYGLFYLISKKSAAKVIKKFNMAFLL